MKVLASVLGIGMLVCASAPAWATDLVNQDAKAQTVTIVVGSITSTKKIAAGGEIYGICNTEPCTLKIGKASISVSKSDRVTYKDGKFSK